MGEFTGERVCAASMGSKGLAARDYGVGGEAVVEGAGSGGSVPEGAGADEDAIVDPDVAPLAEALGSAAPLASITTTLPSRTHARCTPSLAIAHSRNDV